ncbi:HalOD1 output domain-containing protein [Haloarcula onubensis]|uniref:Halobacterial output domain-containing protein n=1 Tax=Haloarcula onubensis TaxID=2950539 RepID=A0ABU2FK78_9EURY|nr:HalOD1 output domain-containing protein [Halomicroarcula sp. S3CR25-11]MDS0280657.1 hypothetical protein [Halomicroarcula sp. S3CR25-11]
MNRSGGDADGRPLVTTTLRGESPTLAVVRAIAAVENEEPMSLRPLGDVIDSEALDAVVDGEGATDVEFTYAGHRVVVCDETVEIY